MDVDGSSGRELQRFLDEEWLAWHSAQGHDPAVDWSGASIKVVARDEAGMIVGAAVGRERAGVGHLSELMIVERLRGSGIGSELLRRFEEHCWSLGCHKLTVHTECDGLAHAFYVRRDWREEAVFRRDRGGRDFVRLCKFCDD